MQATRPLVHRFERFDLLGFVFPRYYRASHCFLLPPRRLEQSPVDAELHLHRVAEHISRGGRYLRRELALQPFLKVEIGDADRKLVLVPREMRVVGKPQVEAWLPNA